MTNEQAEQDLAILGKRDYALANVTEALLHLGYAPTRVMLMLRSAQTELNRMDGEAL